MKCPHCNKTLDVPSFAWGNADTYHNTVKVVTECCGNMVRITPIRKYEVTCVDPNELRYTDHNGNKLDDFGRPIYTTNRKESGNEVRG